MGVDNDLNCQGVAPVISDKYLCILPRNHSCDILVKNMTCFFLCMNNFGSILVADEISSSLV